MSHRDSGVTPTHPSHTQFLGEGLGELLKVPEHWSGCQPSLRQIQ